MLFTYYTIFFSKKKEIKWKEKESSTNHTEEPFIKYIYLFLLVVFLKKNVTYNKKNI